MTDLENQAEPKRSIADRLVLNSAWEVFSETETPAGLALWQAYDVDAKAQRLVLEFPAEVAAETLDAARRAKVLDEPGFVPIVELIEQESGSFVVYEQPRGLSLGELLEAGLLRPETARAVIGMAAQTLDHARRRGLHHRTLDFANIFIDVPSNEVSILGTAVFAAALNLPEVKPEYAAREDTYSLAQLLYESLTDVAAEKQGTDNLVPLASSVAPRPLPEEIVELLDVVLNSSFKSTLVPRTVAALASALEPWQSLPVTLESWDAEDVPNQLTKKRLEEFVAQYPDLAVVVPGAADFAPKETSSDTHFDDAATNDQSAREVAVVSPETMAKESTPEESSVENASLEGTKLEDDPNAESSNTAVLEAAASTADNKSELKLDEPRPASAFPAPLEVKPKLVPQNDPAVAGEAPPTVEQALAKGPRPASAFPSVDEKPAPEPVNDPNVVPVPGKSAFEAAEPLPQDSIDQPTMVIPRIAVAGGQQIREDGTIVVPGRNPVKEAPNAPEAPATLFREVMNVALANDDPAEAAVVAQNRPALTKWILAGFALLTMLALVYAVTNITSVNRARTVLPEATTSAKPAEKPSEAAKPSQAPTETKKSEPTLAPAKIVDVKVTGSRQDHPENIQRVFDGDPNTLWATKFYRSPKFKSEGEGTGLEVKFEAKALVKSVKLTGKNAGGKVQLRKLGPDSAPGEVLAESDFKGDQPTVLTLQKPEEMDGFVLWIVELPKDPQGYRAKIGSITVE